MRRVGTVYELKCGALNVTPGIYIERYINGDGDLYGDDAGKPFASERAARKEAADWSFSESRFSRTMVCLTNECGECTDPLDVINDRAPIERGKVETIGDILSRGGCVFI